MNLREIVRFEFVYQARRVRTWLCFAILLAVAYLVTRGNAEDAARAGGTLVNAPYGIAVTTVIANVLWVLIATAVAGQAAARDVQTRMHPLIYSMPVSKADYLGGRFLAALGINAMILLAVPAGMLLALFVPRVDSALLGPFRPAAYLSAYVLMAVPTAFAATAIQFSLAALARRAAVSYLGSVFLLVAVSMGAGIVANVLRQPTLGKLLDPLGYITVVGLLSKAWSSSEKNTVLVALEGSMLANRLVWIGIGLAVLAFTYQRFRFGDPAARPRAKRAMRRRETPIEARDARP